MAGGSDETLHAWCAELADQRSGFEVPDPGRFTKALLAALSAEVLIAVTERFGDVTDKLKRLPK